MVLDNRDPVCQKPRSASIWNPGRNRSSSCWRLVISLLIITNCNVDHGLCEEDAHIACPPWRSRSCRWSRWRLRPGCQAARPSPRILTEDSLQGKPGWKTYDLIFSSSLEIGEAFSTDWLTDWFSAKKKTSEWAVLLNGRNSKNTLYLWTSTKYQAYQQIENLGQLRSLWVSSIGSQGKRKSPRSTWVRHIPNIIGLMTYRY